MYKFSHFLQYSQGNTLLSHANETRNLCHERYGHLKYMYLQALIKEIMVEGFSTIKFSNDTCKWCVVGKHVERRYEKGKEISVFQVIDLIHSDLIGPLPKPSYGNSRYVFTFIDDFSWFCLVYFLKLKYEVFYTLKAYKDLVENACGKKIKFLMTENGNEYVNNKLQQLCHEIGIQMQHFVPYTPQQNGVAERKNRALKEMETCMMEENKLSHKIWDESINCAAYIQNISPHK